MLGTDGLLAPGRHTVTAAEFKATFVEGFPDSSTRAELYTRWLRHRAAILGHVPILSQWIDGSFVTNKDDPGDIDVVTIMHESNFIALAPVAQSMLASLLAGKKTKAVWGMDSYPVYVVPSGHPAEAAVQKAADGWHSEWSRVKRRPGVIKGYLEVTP